MALFDTPVPFDEAIDALMGKNIAPSAMDSAAWKKLSSVVREQSFFSSTNLYKSVLDALRDQTLGLIEPSDQPGQIMDMGTARLKIKRMLEQLGYDPDTHQGSDLSTDGRINLVLNTNRDMAEGAGKFIQDNDPDVVDAFPAWELYRLESRLHPRGEKDPEDGWDARWEAACDEEGDDKALEVFENTGRMIALKSSGVWDALGDGAGGYDDTLGNPYPPFAFNSGMWVTDVSREECDDLGLTEEDEEVEGADEGEGVEHLIDELFETGEFIKDVGEAVLGSGSELENESSFLSGSNYVQPVRKYIVGWAPRKKKKIYRTKLAGSGLTFKEFVNEGKASQQAALYMPPASIDKSTQAGEGARCGKCALFNAYKNQCYVTTPAACNAEHGVCGLFIGGKSIVLPNAQPNLLISKEIVGYIENAPTRCGTCEYFDDDHSCALVKGQIDRNGCCNFWDARKPGQKAAVANPYLPYVAFDFDGTLAVHKEDEDQSSLPRPVWPMLAKLKKYLRQGYLCKIMTARADNPQGAAVVNYFLHKYGLPPLEVTNKKTPGMIKLYDDKAATVERNTGRILSPSMPEFHNRRVPDPDMGDVIASVVVIAQGQVATVASRANGTRSLPAGHRDEGESLEITAQRELKEETGLDVPLKDLVFIGRQWRTDRGQIDAIFGVHNNGLMTELEPGTDADEAEWESIEALPSLKFNHELAIDKARSVLAQNPDKRGMLIVFEGVDGAGKCWAKGTKIRMHDGSDQCVEQIKVGDLVMGPDSKPRRVTSLGRGREMMYRVRPIKGQPFVCNASHILTLRIAGKKRQLFGADPLTGRVEITAAQYSKKSRCFKRYAQLYRAGVEYKPKAVRVDPYILGLWLGDGTAALNSFAIDKPDHEIRQALEAEAKSRGLRLSINGMRHRICGTHPGDRCNSLLVDMRSYQLTKNKHIPSDYLINDEQTRLQLLAGILDADGHLNHNGFEFVNINKRLADQVLTLARSLSFAAYMRRCRKSCAVGTYWRININGDTDRIPTRIARKQAKKRRINKDWMVSGIRSVRAIGVGDYYGFTLKEDPYFLLADFTVAHNSTQLDQLSQWLSTQAIPYSATKWNSSPVISDRISDLKKQRRLSPVLFFLLHAADMLDRYENEILPALRRNEVVLCDRYFYTGLVRDGLRGIDRDYNAKLYAKIRQPDLVFHCQIDPAIAVHRLAEGRGLKHYSAGMDIPGLGPDKFSSALEYERRMDEMYQTVLPNHTMRLNMNQKIETIAAEVVRHVEGPLSAKYGSVPVNESWEIGNTGTSEGAIKGWLTRKSGMSPAESEELYKQLKEGGFTYHALTHDSPKSGFVVSAYKEAETIIPAGRVRESNIRNFFAVNKPILAKDPTAHIGGWLNRDNHKVYLDVVKVLPDRESALQQARSINELAIYDLGAGKEISAQMANEKSKGGVVRFIFPRDIDPGDAYKALRKMLDDPQFANVRETGNARVIFPKGATAAEIFRKLREYLDRTQVANAGTSEGAKLAWEKRQRAADKQTEIKRERALQNFKPSTAEKRHIAEGYELKVAQAIGGTNLPDNEPPDVVKGKNAIECKTILDGKNPKITMHKESLARKLSYGRANKVTWHTVVIDARDRENPVYYYRQGVGSFRLEKMERLNGIEDLNKRIGGRHAEASNAGTREGALKAWENMRRRRAEAKEEKARVKAEGDPKDKIKVTLNGTATIYDEENAKLIASFNPTGSITPIELYGPKDSLGKALLSGKEYDLAGRYDPSQGTLKAQNDWNTISHEMGHSDYRHAMDWGHAAVQKRIEEFDAQDHPGKSIYSDDGGFIERDTHLIVDPRNADERLHNELWNFNHALLESYHGQAVPTMYAMSYAMPPQSKVYDHAQMAKPFEIKSKEAGKTETYYPQIFPRLTNESYAEYSAGYSYDKLKEHNAPVFGGRQKSGDRSFSELGNEEGRKAWLNLRHAIEESARERHLTFANTLEFANAGNRAGALKAWEKRKRAEPKQPEDPKPKRTGNPLGPHKHAINIFHDEKVSQMDLLATRMIASEFASAPLTKITVHSSKDDLGGFEAAGQTFKRGGSYDPVEDKIEAQAYPEVVAHELGHADYHHGLNWANEALQQRVADFQRTRKEGQDIFTDSGGFYRADGRIQDPRNAAERLYNAFEDYHSALHGEKEFPSDYARTWMKESMDKNYFDRPMNRDKEGWIRESSIPYTKADGQAGTIPTQSFPRGDNEAFAEFSSGFVQNKLAKHGLLAIYDIQRPRYGWPEKMGTGESRKAFLNLRNAIFDAARERQSQFHNAGTSEGAIKAWESRQRGETAEYDSRETIAKHTRNGEFTPERKALHDRIVNESLAGVPSVSDPQFVILGGGPAAGKSTMIKTGHVQLPEKYVLVNADNIKDKLPEYQQMVKDRDPSAGTLAHEESAHIAKRMMAESLATKRNVVLDGTGDGSLAKLKSKIDAARAAGFRVIAEYATTDHDVAQARNIARAKETGRLVPETFLRDNHRAVARILPEAVKRGMFDKMRLWNNDKTPVLVASAQGDKLTIHDQALYDKFLSSGK